MYFFYFDESGSRDPSIGTTKKPKEHLYVLLAVGMYERKWHSFELAISQLKLELAECLERDDKGRFDLADCEVKSNWIRIEDERKKKSSFLHSLHDKDLGRLIKAYYQQILINNMVIIAVVIDKRYLRDHMTHELLHKKAYELVLERIQHYIREYHPKHQALIVMDDTDKQLNRSVAMKHAFFQRTGNQNMLFPNIVEYPFFTRSELSNGIQLADLLAYNVYRAFRDGNLAYPYFERLLPNIYYGRKQMTLHGLKVWPEDSPLVDTAKRKWEAHKRKNLPKTG